MAWFGYSVPLWFIFSAYSSTEHKGDRPTSINRGEGHLVVIESVERCGSADRYPEKLLSNMETFPGERLSSFTSKRLVNQPPL